MVRGYDLAAQRANGRCQSRKSRYSLIPSCSKRDPRHARKFKTELAPVFPGYIFVILNLDGQRWRSVNGTHGITRLIADGHRPLAVTPGIVETLIQSSDDEGCWCTSPNSLSERG